MVLGERLLYSSDYSLKCIWLMRREKRGERSERERKKSDPFSILNPGDQASTHKDLFRCCTVFSGRRFLLLPLLPPLAFFCFFPHFSFS